MSQREEAVNETLLALVQQLEEVKRVLDEILRIVSRGDKLCH